MLAEPRDVVVLHGDLHHDNVLDFGERGWLAIDPRCLRGERGFDYANIFTNPDMADPSRPVTIRPEHFARRLAMVTARSAAPPPAAMDPGLDRAVSGLADRRRRRRRGRSCDCRPRGG
nr:MULTISPECIES: aminoglycoside phosphotransferase family protein [unclassified Bradyrhizobium]